MAESVSIRLAAVDDAEGVVRANEESWNASMAGLIDKKLEDLAPFDARVARTRAGLEDPPPGLCVWVAERDGRIVGHATVSVEGEAGELRGLYLVPDEWGGVVARALHDQALVSMRDLGATEAALWVVERNARARRFYEREGWEADGATKSEVFDITEARYRRTL